MFGGHLVSNASPSFIVFLTDGDYRQQTAVPLTSETHGGEDVAIMAKGPYAHLFHGIHEQTYIHHVMAFAACLEPYQDCPRSSGNSGSLTAPSIMLILISVWGVLLQ